MHDEGGLVELLEENGAVEWLLRGMIEIDIQFDQMVAVTQVEELSEIGCFDGGSLSEEE